MILFKTIRWKNFLSTGNQHTEIDFTKNKTNLIIGTNGAGKSTVLDALTFALFGKPFRKINKPQLANSVNEKDCRVEVEFTIGNVDWKVIRGIKPAIFEIWRSGSLMDQSAAALDQQKWLEQNVLKMNYVIEDLLDIKIFSSMNTVIKEKIRQSKEEIKVLDLKKQSLAEKLKMQEEFIEELENRGKDNINNNNRKISDLDKEIEQYLNENTSLEEPLRENITEQDKLIGYADKLRKLGNLKGKISQKVSTITKEHKFFTENTVCPTCTQEIEDEFRINKINDAQNKAKELQSGYKELEEAIKEEEERERQFNTLSKEISKLTNGISQNNIKINGLQRQIRNLEHEIQVLTENLANRNSEHEKLESFKDNLKTTYDELASKKDLINYYDFSYSLLKDGGVKSKIIKKYLPLINQQVNRYLQMMDFYINFTLDEEFNETVQSPIHEDFSYASFSEGEKQRIDLALLFTWREVARFKNSVNTNLMILDEIFDSSLDATGTEEFLKIIRYVVKDANIFVISHKTGLEDRFESVIKFSKVKGFSRMV